MNVEPYFSANYVEARAQFLRLSEAHGFAVRSHRNEHAQAPDGSDLYLDVATKGPADASKRLVLCSGTHGVEGYCGSGIQGALLGGACFAEAPGDLKVALVHAVNPYGFAHDRRVNEDNIDLNRNFLDFGSETPRDNGYGEIHEYLVPADWGSETRRAADAGLARYIKDHGPRALQHAASGGQYTHPNGLFYGGIAPSWSARTICSIAAVFAASSQQAFFIDIHTGLGPYGVGEMIAAGSSAQVQRTFDFYDQYELTDPDAGTSSSAPVQGTMAHGVERALPGVETHFLAREFGTLPMKDVMTALRADNWLYQAGSVGAELRTRIKGDIRNAFYCDEPEWKSMVYARAADIIDATLQKLAS